MPDSEGSNVKQPMSDAAGAALDDAEGNAEKKPNLAGATDDGGIKPLSSLLEKALQLASDRTAGLVKPIDLPWPSMNEQFGGGLWPGLHVLVSGTGTGKTTWAMQVALHAARQGAPVGYVGLELGEDEVALRLLGELAGVSWSKLWLGKAGPDDLQRAKAARAEAAALPIHVVPGSPQGYPASALRTLVQSLQKAHPKAARSPLIVLDFLQIIGDERTDQGRPMGLELRERIGRAAYAARDVARSFNAAVLLVSSTGRQNYNLQEALEAAGLSYRNTKDGPVDRRLFSPDALVGVGKESGEIEFSADSVTVGCRVRVEMEGVPPGETSVVFATAKGRATGTGWTELRFNGHQYVEPEDHGGRFVDGWEARKNTKKPTKAERATPPKNGAPIGDDDV